MRPSSDATNQRRGNRTKAVLPVKVKGNDSTGKPFEELVHTLDVTHHRRTFRLGAARVECARRSHRLLPHAQDSVPRGVDEEDERHVRISDWAASGNARPGSLGHELRAPEPAGSAGSGVASHGRSVRAVRRARRNGEVYERFIPQSVIEQSLWSDEQGQDIAEYSVMLAVILVIVVGTVRLDRVQRGQRLLAGRQLAAVARTLLQQD